MDENIEKFIAKLRSAIDSGGGGGTQPLDSETYRLARRVGSADSDLLDHFVNLAESAGMVVHRPTGKNELIDQIGQLLAELDVKTVIAEGDEILPGVSVPDILGQSGDIELIEFAADRQSLTEAAFRADCSITGVYAALAETGSIALRPSKQCPLLLPLAAPVHIAICPAGKIYADLLDLLTPENIERGALTLITGPSKTADIEMELVTGMHGPIAEHLFVVA